MLKITKLKEALDYIMKIAPGLDSYGIQIYENIAAAEEANLPVCDLPFMYIIRVTATTLNINVKLNYDPQSHDGETQYTRFWNDRNRLCQDFYLTGSLKRDLPNVVNIFLRKHSDVECTYNTVCQILELYGYDPGVTQLQIVPVISNNAENTKESAPYDNKHMGQPNFSENHTLSAVIADALNDAMSLTAGVDPDTDREYIAIAFGTESEPEKILAFVSPGNINFSSPGAGDTGKNLTPETLNHYIAYPNYQLLYFHTYEVGYCGNLDNPGYVVDILTDYISYFHPELTPEDLIIAIQPLVDDIESTHNLHYLHDGTRPTREQLTYTRDLILRQYELDSKDADIE